MNRNWRKAQKAREKMREVQKPPSVPKSPARAAPWFSGTRQDTPTLACPPRPLLLPPFPERPLALGKANDVPGMLKSPLFSSAAYRWLCSRGSLQPPRPPGCIAARPAANGKTPEHWPPAFRACETQPGRSEERTLRGSDVPSLLRLRPNFAASFSSCRFKGKAEVQAARCGSCTTDLYTRTPLLCCAEVLW